MAAPKGAVDFEHLRYRQSDTLIRTASPMRYPDTKEGRKGNFLDELLLRQTVPPMRSLETGQAPSLPGSVLLFEGETELFNDRVC